MGILMLYNSLFIFTTFMVIPFYIGLKISQKEFNKSLKLKTMVVKTRIKSRNRKTK